MDIGSELWPREKELLSALLFNRESSIALDWQEEGRIRPEIVPPHAPPTDHSLDVVAELATK